MNDSKTRTALISVTAKDKPPIVDFVKGLRKTGEWDILASGGTCKYLKKAGIEVTDVADLIGGAAILGHRVVTLSREVYAGLLAQPNEADLKELADLGIPFIDLVCCDFYPLSVAIAKEDATVESVIEATDIGGPTMVSAAAKGRRIVICDPVDRQVVIDDMADNNGDIDPLIRNILCIKADRIVAEYRLASAEYHSHGETTGVIGQGFLKLDKGESGRQSPAFLYSNPNITYPLAWRYFKLESGLPGYVNMGDLDRVLQIMCRGAAAFEQNLFHCPFIVIACKHGNACGMGIDFDSPEGAINKAMLGDPIAVMGGEIMVNFDVSGRLAELLFSVPELSRDHVGRKNWGADIICAPEFSDSAIALLGKREKRKLLSNSALRGQPAMNNNSRMLRVLSTNEFLTQGSPSYVLKINFLDQVVGGVLARQDVIDMIIAWVCAWQADSNTASLANGGMLIGLGCGDQDRIWCCDEAIRKAERARHIIKGAKFGSDGFFPYAKRDDESRPEEGLELFVNAGCSGGVVPADGKNFQLVKEYAISAGLKVAFLDPLDRGFMFHA